VVVTADAPDTQRDHASFLIDCGADYLLFAKANQRALHAQLAGLPWRQIRSWTAPASTPTAAARSGP